MRGELYVREIVRGILAIVVGVMLVTTPVSAATGGATVITARVMPVRHIVINKDGVILRIVSNTAESVAPVVHFGSFEGPEVAMSDEVSSRYEHLIAHLDMKRPADYVRKSDTEIALTQLRRVALLPLQTISQIGVR